MTPLRNVSMVLLLFLGLMVTAQGQVNKTNNTPGTAAGNTINRTVNYVSGVDFPGGSTISDVDISITWDDPGASGFGFAEEITFWLTSPGGEKVVLVYDAFNTHGRGASIPATYNGFADLAAPVTVIFDQGAANVVGQSGPGGGDPVSGTFRPEVQNPLDNLDNYNGDSPFGTWTLTIGDGSAGFGDVGFLSFTLSVSVAGPACSVGSIASNPSPASHCATETAQFSITTSGAIDSVRWFQAPGIRLNNGGNVSGANTTTLTLANVAAGQNGNQYFARVYGCSPVDSAQSTSATLTVIPYDPPVVTSDPADATACTGDIASFSVSATGTGLSYQWQTNASGSFQDIPGATASTLNVIATGNLNGKQYRCVVSGTCSPPATSAAATLSTTPTPVLSATRTNSTGGCFENQCNVTQTVDFSGTTGGVTIDSVVISIEFSTHQSSCTPTTGFALNGEVGFSLRNNTTGTSVNLIRDDQNCLSTGASTYNGFNAVSNVVVTLTENANDTIGTNANPTTGSFRPEQSLASFIGENPEGIWTLHMAEVSPTGKLILHNWSVIIYYGGSQGACCAGNPVLTSVFPVANSNNIPLSSMVYAVFDSAMDAASVDSTTFVVHGNMGGYRKATLSVNNDTVKLMVAATDTFHQN